MKRPVVLALVLSFACTYGFAAVGADAQREAHRQEMKAVKAAQREARKNAKNNPTPPAPGFWQKEGERSGLSRIGNTGEFMRNLNPMPFFKTQDEQYKARKAAGQAK